MKIRKKITLFLLTKTEKEKPQFRRSTPKTVLNICLSYKPQFKGKFRCLCTVYVSMDTSMETNDFAQNLVKRTNEHHLYIGPFPRRSCKGKCCMHESKENFKNSLEMGGVRD